MAADIGKIDVADDTVPQKVDETAAGEGNDYDNPGEQPAQVAGDPRNAFRVGGAVGSGWEARKTSHGVCSRRECRCS